MVITSRASRGVVIYDVDFPLTPTPFDRLTTPLSRQGRGI
jgi:hypothetical protein